MMTIEELERAFLDLEFQANRIAKLKEVDPEHLQKFNAHFRLSVRTISRRYRYLGPNCGAAADNSGEARCQPLYARAATCTTLVLGTSQHALP